MAQEAGRLRLGCDDPGDGAKGRLVEAVEGLVPGAARGEVARRHTEALRQRGVGEGALEPTREVRHCVSPRTSASKCARTSARTAIQSSLNEARATSPCSSA